VLYCEEGNRYMKTILWATLTANGTYAQSSPEHPPKREALDDFARQARAVGNFILGRRTFEVIQAIRGGAFSDVDIVVVSSSVTELPGVKLVGSPQAALNYLQTKGHQTALLAGGADLHNAFLGQGLVDELMFNIAPVLEGKGLNLLLNKDHYQYKDIQLLDFKSLGGGVVQLHFAVGRE
jgi:dihydrofolate reductase